MHVLREPRNKRSNAAIEFRLAQSGLTRRALQPIMGSRGRVSEILTGRRPLTIPMIRALSTEFEIPAEILISEARPARKATKRPSLKRAAVRA